MPMETSPLGGLVTAGLQRTERFREGGGSVLVARAGFFAPDGDDGRPPRTHALAHLLGAGAGAAEVVRLVGGHR